MAKMIQIRHVPEEIHRTLKAHAAKEGMSLSEYLLRELRKVAEVATNQEILEGLRSRPIRRFSPSPTEIIRQERDRR